MVGKAINFADCAVYGVQVPGNEGRAGMLALSLGKNVSCDKNSKVVANGNAAAASVEVVVAEESSESTEAQEVEMLRDLADVFKKELPPYARPLFVRFMKELDTTGKLPSHLIVYLSDLSTNWCCVKMHAPCTSF